MSVGVGIEGGEEQRGVLGIGKEQKDRSVEKCEGFRHTWTRGYTIPTWGDVACWSWVC